MDLDWAALLQQAAQDPDAFCARLTTEPRLAHARNPAGETLLHSILSVAMPGSTRRLLVESLVFAGADVNALTLLGEAPIHRARGSVLETLLARGADPALIHGLSRIERDILDGDWRSVQTFLRAGLHPRKSWPALSQREFPPEHIPGLARGLLPLDTEAALHIAASLPPEDYREFEFELVNFYIATHQAEAAWRIAGAWYEREPALSAVAAILEIAGTVELRMRLGARLADLLPEANPRDPAAESARLALARHCPELLRDLQEEHSYAAHLAELDPDTLLPWPELARELAAGGPARMVRVLNHAMRLTHHGRGQQRDHLGCALFEALVPLDENAALAVVHGLTDPYFREGAAIGILAGVAAHDASRALELERTLGEIPEGSRALMVIARRVALYDYPHARSIAESIPNQRERAALLDELAQLYNG